MTRCQAFCISGKRCKNKTNDTICFIHDGSLNCEFCDIKGYRLKCGHTFCKKCINLHQFDTFSTNDIIKCPVCEIELCDNDWSYFANICVDSGNFRRQIDYVCYINPKQITVTDDIYSKKYSQYEALKIYQNITGKFTFVFKEVDTVYFIKNEGTYKIINDKYLFKIDFQKLKEDNDHFYKELVEYVYHPSRIKLDQLD